MFEPNDQVKLVIGSMSFLRTVNYIHKGAVFLKEGGDSFHNTTGKIYGMPNSNIHIKAI